MTVQGEFEGLPAWKWARRSRTWHRRFSESDRTARARAATIRAQRHVLAHSPTVAEALGLARVVYGVDQAHRAHCESRGRVRAHNKSGASSVLQFLPSTWATTPFAAFSIWSPYAQALAGGWMVAVAHRSGEWDCPL